MTAKWMLIAITLVLALGGRVLAVGVEPAAASSSQISIIQDDNQLLLDPAATLAKFRRLGVQVVKVTIRWDAIAPGKNARRRPRGFHPVSPAAYPPRNWASYDEIDRAAHADGLRLYFALSGGAPRWAQGPGQPPRPRSHPGWAPSPGEFEAFVRAVGRRYDGSYTPAGASTPLPRVSFWSVWNEPNLGYMLSPQGVPGHLSVENSGHLYRRLLDAAWAGLSRTGHGNDTVLIGELAPRGGSRWGEFQTMKPLVFLRALYCVDSSYHALRGQAAAIRDCPTTAAASRRFRARHPALFRASGFADHMWMRWYPPNREERFDPDYSSLAEIGQLLHALDRVQHAYGSTARLPVYNTEFGYITSPPNTSTIYRTGSRPTSYPSPATAAEYLNWAEYISWQRRRVSSFDQYLLRDPPPFSSPYVAWSSGLRDWETGAQKETYAAWMLPLYLPVRSTATRSRRVEVWGCIRPGTYALLDTGMPQTAAIQFAPGDSESFVTLRHVTITSSSNCYFDVQLTLPGSGSLRLMYTYPTLDPLLGSSATIYSRDVTVARG
jgi:hypothetical protein